MVAIALPSRVSKSAIGNLACRCVMMLSAFSSTRFPFFFSMVMRGVLCCLSSTMPRLANAASLQPQHHLLPQIVRRRVCYLQPACHQPFLGACLVSAGQRHCWMGKRKAWPNEQLVYIAGEYGWCLPGRQGPSALQRSVQATTTSHKTGEACEPAILLPT